MTDETIDEEKLRQLMNEVAALPRSIDPPASAWSEIRARIDAQKNAAVSHTPERVVFWHRPMFLAAAGLVLVAGSSAITAIALNRGAQPAAVATQQSQQDPTNASLAQFTVRESDYLRAVNDLTATLDNERGSLSPETIATLRESIKVIDAAILEARNALAADPANKTLIEILANSYEQKVDLLKRTTEMARS